MNFFMLLLVALSIGCQLHAMEKMDQSDSDDNTAGPAQAAGASSDDSGDGGGGRRGKRRSGGAEGCPLAKRWEGEAEPLADDGGGDGGGGRRGKRRSDGAAVGEPPSRRICTATQEAFAGGVIQAGMSFERELAIAVPDVFGCSPLHYAATPETVDFLIQGGADVNLPDACGLTPLHRAIFRGLPDVVARLVVVGAYVDDYALEIAQGRLPEDLIDWLGMMQLYC